MVEAISAEFGAPRLAAEQDERKDAGAQHDEPGNGDGQEERRGQNAIPFCSPNLAAEPTGPCAMAAYQDGRFRQI